MDKACCLQTEQCVAAYCEEHALLAAKAVVYVALSGGADSMALLRILLRIAPQFGVAVRACHVNHCLRGSAADADEAFVRAACEALSVPLAVFHAVKSGMPPPDGAGETWARQVRYGFFEDLIDADNVFVATAHSQNDQAETLLFRLARGTGVHGAAGIRPCRQRFIRPLLCLTRAQIEQYCGLIRQDYVTDETNAQTVFARNHLRVHAVPSLCYANEGAVQHIGQFCEKMAQIDCYFAQQAQVLLQEAADVSQGAQAWSLAALRQAHPLVLAAAMYQLVCPLRDAEQKYADALCALVQEGVGAVQIVPSVRFVAKDGVLRMIKQEKEPVKSPQMVEYYPVKPGVYTFPNGYRVKIERIVPEIMEKIQLVHKKDLKNYADYDKMVSSLVLRCRAQGDVFAPAGRGISKTVKKLHNELGIPQAERGQMPLLADGHTVVWLWGQGFAQGYAPCENTRMFLKITEEKIAEGLDNAFNHG